MPFRSESQRRFLWLKHPEVAKKWSHEYGSPKDLPDHVKHMGDIMAKKKMKKKSGKK